MIYLALLLLAFDGLATIAPAISDGPHARVTRPVVLVAAAASTVCALLMIFLAQLEKGTTQ